MNSEKWKPSSGREVLEYIKLTNDYYLEYNKDAKNNLFKIKLPNQTRAEEVHRSLRRGARNRQ